jgi:hypothetical protein
MLPATRENPQSCALNATDAVLIAPFKFSPAILGYAVSIDGRLERRTSARYLLGTVISRLLKVIPPSKCISHVSHSAQVPSYLKEKCSALH